MPSNPTPASDGREVCGDCGLPKATTRPAIREANGELCGAHLSGQNCGYVLPAVDLFMACHERTIARLRRELEQRDGRIARAEARLNRKRRELLIIRLENIRDDWQWRGRFGVTDPLAKHQCAIRAMFAQRRLDAISETGATKP